MSATCRQLLNRFHVIQNSKQASPTDVQTSFDYPVIAQISRSQRNLDFQVFANLPPYKIVTLALVQSIGLVIKINLVKMSRPKISCQF